MKQFIKNISYEEISLLTGKTVNFKSDCEFFPNFDVTGKVYKIERRIDETIIYVKTKSGKNITIGSNMKNLSYEIN